MTAAAMRILHTEASTGWGGQEIRILDETAGLRARGHDVRIAAPAAAPIADAAHRRGLPLHAVELDRRSWASARALGALLADFRPHVIVTHSSGDSWHAAFATRFSKPRPAIVRTRHLSTPVAGGPLNRWLYGSVAARIVSTGEAIRSHLIDKLSLPPSHVISIPTGVDTARFRPGDRAAARQLLGLPHRPIVGTVATLRRWKGHEYLIAALADPRLAEIEFVFVGDGPFGARLREQAEAAGVGARVTFAGRQEDVVPWLHAFDIFALPSTGNEGVPQAALQALACGLPVIATPVGAVAEVVREGETGLLVAPRDSAALAAAIDRLRREPGLANRLAERGRALVADRYTSTIMLDGMERVLREAAGG